MLLSREIVLLVKVKNSEICEVDVKKIGKVTWHDENSELIAIVR